MLTDSALVELEAASERLDKTVALPNKDSVPKAPVFAQTMPLAQQAPSAPKQQVFAGTMPLGGTSGVPSIALRPTEPAPQMAPPPPRPMPMQPMPMQPMPMPMPMPMQPMEQPRPPSSNRGLLWMLVILLVLSLVAAVGVALLLVERRGH